MNFEEIHLYKSHGTGIFKRSDFAQIGNHVIFEKGVRIFHPRQIEIGNNVYIGHGTILKGYYNSHMVIDDHTWIGQNCFLHSAGGIRIGKAVGIGPGVTILTSAHGSGELSRPVISNPLEFGEVVIRDGSDIGVNTTILPGVTINEGSIIGAGSIVTKDVPPFSIVAGNPARILRNRR